MYQALVRLPAHPFGEDRADKAAEQMRARFDWRALLRFQMRLLSPAPRR